MAEPTAARAWRTVLERIERDLVEGRLGPGDRLPSERELSSELGVGRSSVREALRVLEVMGLIRTSTGSGPQAGAIVIATPAGGLEQLLRLQVAAQGFPIADVVQTRVVLEGAVAASLAASESRETADAHILLEAMDDATLPAPEFLALDAQLHLALAEASGNAVIAAMMAGLRTAIESYVLEGSARIDDWTGMAQRLRVEHRALVAAIDDGDADRARVLVRDHIIGYYTAAGLVPDTAV
ncbi:MULTISPECIES: FadR/GntR family transcriptional regulator [unclassified Microbacterium]|uniref:FadR/GntR family transcriptional regulator n=1 Tax=unclassified Microbacterium TaxID=2609290 RepID=UPI0012F7ADF1|nr:GntR family transcriptional regulator [Microbacterium sp. MAH-37]MVQ40903.1 GntR family transcriptional regulator [Microbacterium sp. MAH-37]